MPRGVQAATIVSMTPLPTGTVTFLFTDIEGSTRMLRDVGQVVYAGALTRHHALMREAIASAGGVEVGTEGDAFFVAFGGTSLRSSSDAVAK